MPTLRCNDNQNPRCWPRNSYLSGLPTSWQGVDSIWYMVDGGVGISKLRLNYHLPPTIYYLPATNQAIIIADDNATYW